MFALCAEFRQNCHGFHTRATEISPVPATRLIEPLILAVMGVVVVFLIALYLPILNLTPVGGGNGR